jgi:hypothetical protein
MVNKHSTRKAAGPRLLREVLFSLELHRCSSLAPRGGSIERLGGDVGGGSSSSFMPTVGCSYSSDVLGASSSSDTPVQLLLGLLGLQR